MNNNYDPLDIRGQERDREDKARLASVELENEESDLRWLMSSRRGRRIVFRLLDQSGPMRDPFDQNALVMARKSGETRLGIRLQAIILLGFPELYVQMIRDRNGRDNNSNGDAPKSN